MPPGLRRRTAYKQGTSGIGVLRESCESGRECTENPISVAHEGACIARVLRSSTRTEEHRYKPRSHAPEKRRLHQEYKWVRGNHGAARMDGECAINSYGHG